eukprot:CAMPEP_0204073826 /NCGR_PEP_ID=MMETSP0360-20130528/163869_1 /ASSEMBLY_ACC=CAM_ASM_000342 /TAXON_ID=268821 /ORGANISM="Scrippsiella Hangoei, Strain SHTV-5" /LENGTH=58 /DNA_ID=CAMNT_0051022247 /DNA_START=8 /DNA_END=181 /DNA_ORIENTATION=+
MCLTVHGAAAPGNNGGSAADACPRGGGVWQRRRSPEGDAGADPLFEPEKTTPASMPAA